MRLPSYGLPVLCICFFVKLVSLCEVHETCQNKVLRTRESFATLTGTGHSKLSILSIFSHPHIYPGLLDYIFPLLELKRDAGQPVTMQCIFFHKVKVNCDILPWVNDGIFKICFVYDLLYNYYILIDLENFKNKLFLIWCIWIIAF